MAPPETSSWVPIGVLKQHPQVLELGSGTGIVGITAALLGGRVMMTDLPEALASLTSNIERNAGAIWNAGGTAVALPWDWDSLTGMPLKDVKTECFSASEPLDEAGGAVNKESLSPDVIKTQPESIDADGGAALILGADLVYSPRQVLIGVKSSRRVIGFGMLDHARNAF